MLELTVMNLYTMPTMQAILARLRNDLMMRDLGGATLTRITEPTPMSTMVVIVWAGSSRAQTRWSAYCSERYSRTICVG
jgi:hypothetical protein